MALVIYQAAQHQQRYEAAFAAYELPGEQQLYSALPQAAIAVSDRETSRRDVLILEEGRLVGFFVLDGGVTAVREYSSNERALLLRSFSIDYPKQGKGLAKKALRQLPQWLHQNFPNNNEIVLGVNSRNQAAIQLYLGSGFVDEGQRIKTSYGELLVLSLKLSGGLL